MTSATTDTDHPLWDWPVRIIHWLIALLLPASWWTAHEGYLDVHQWLGLTIMVAVITRLVWGFIGSPQARFRDFMRAPVAALGYLRGVVASRTPGHNPAGAYSALLLWMLLLAQAFTGSVSADDVLFTGPFHYVFDSAVADALAELHEPLFNLIAALVALHLAAVFYHERVKRRQLVWPMVVGKTAGRVGTGRAQPLYKALAVAAASAALLCWLMAIAPAPPPPFYW